MYCVSEVGCSISFVHGLAVPQIVGHPFNYDGCLCMDIHHAVISGWLNTSQEVEMCSATE